MRNEHLSEQLPIRVDAVNAVGRARPQIAVFINAPPLSRPSAPTSKTRMNCFGWSLVSSPVSAT